MAALAGGNVSIQRLDGRPLEIPLGGDVTAPGATRVVRGEGMPVSKAAGQAGDLHVTFEVAFPKKLSEEKKKLVRQALA